VHCNICEEQEGYRAGYYMQKQLRVAEIRRRKRVMQKLERRNRGKRKEAKKRAREVCTRNDEFGNNQSRYVGMSKRAKSLAKSQETAKQNARKKNVDALAEVPPKVLCKNLCGRSYLRKSTKRRATHEMTCEGAWGPGEDTGVPEMSPETPAATGEAGMDVLMGIAAVDEQTLM
jgi:hypothetical protein